MPHKYEDYSDEVDVNKAENRNFDQKQWLTSAEELMKVTVLAENSGSQPSFTPLSTSRWCWSLSQVGTNHTFFLYLFRSNFNQDNINW